MTCKIFLTWSLESLILERSKGSEDIGVPFEVNRTLKSSASLKLIVQQLIHLQKITAVWQTQWTGQSILTMCTSAALLSNWMDVCASFICFYSPEKTQGEWRSWKVEDINWITIHSENRLHHDGKLIHFVAVETLANVLTSMPNHCILLNALFLTDIYLRTGVSCVAIFFVYFCRKKGIISSQVGCENSSTYCCQ